MIVLSSVLHCFAQLPFITKWDLSYAGTGATQIKFGVGTFGTVSYTWQQLTGGSAIGGGSFSGIIATITGLPAGATIRLSINPAHFTGFNFVYSGLDNNRLVDVEQWGTVAWGSMWGAFFSCSNLYNITAVDLPNLNGVTSMKEMFEYCYNLNGPSNINNWNTSTITNMSRMFNGASAFNQPIGNWNTSAVTDMNNMFNNAYAFNQPIDSWNTAAVTNMQLMFYGTQVFNQSIGSWNTSAVTDMCGTFASTFVFNQPIDSWNTSSVTDMSYMFSQAHAFNQPIGSWNTASVINTRYMFSQTNAFNQPIGSWDLSADTSMFRMFFSATAFNQPLGSWNTIAVTNMSQMFYWANTFNQFIDNWNTTAVTNMSAMFTGAPAFNQPIGNWNTSSVISMNSMFSSAYSFNQSLANWNLSSSIDLNYMLMNCGIDCFNYSATLVGWNANTNTPNGLHLDANTQYDTSAAAARLNLITTKGWTISNDIATGTSCLSTVGYSLIANQQSTIDIYPNPFTLQTTIIFNQEQKNTTIKITDLLGKEIKTINFTGKQLVIDKAEMKAGVYFLQTIDDKKNITNNKIIIQ